MKSMEYLRKGAKGYKEVKNAKGIECENGEGKEHELMEKIAKRKVKK